MKSTDFVRLELDDQRRSTAEHWKRQPSLKWSLRRGLKQIDHVQHWLKQQRLGPGTTFIATSRLAVPTNEEAPSGGVLHNGMLLSFWTGHIRVYDHQQASWEPVEHLSDLAPYFGQFTVPEQLGWTSTQQLEPAFSSVQTAARSEQASQRWAWTLRLVAGTWVMLYGAWLLNRQWQTGVFSQHLFSLFIDFSCCWLLCFGLTGWSVSQQGRKLDLQRNDLLGFLMSA